MSILAIIYGKTYLLLYYLYPLFYFYRFKTIFKYHLYFKIIAIFKYYIQKS